MGLDISTLPKDHPLRKKIEQADPGIKLPKSKKPRNEPEHDLQCEAVDLFPVLFPSHKGKLFAIPNGGHRNKTVGGKLKAEGVLPGVWDLFLAVPLPGAGGLWIETKAGDNTLSDSQTEFREMLQADYDFFVYRRISEFIEGVNNYLNRKSNTHLHE